jgi:hypothetical protein
MVARRHHYVPKCYLNSFAAPKKGRQKPELLSFDAMQGKCIRTAPDDVALQRDFNTINLEGHLKLPDITPASVISGGPRMSRADRAQGLPPGPAQHALTIY